MNDDGLLYGTIYSQYRGDDLRYVRASKIYLQPDPHQKPPPVTEPYQPFDHEYEEKKEEEEEDEEEDKSDGW